VYDDLKIQSHKGPYSVHFLSGGLQTLNDEALDNTHVIIDRKIFDLYQQQIKALVSLQSLLIVDATEESKSLDKMPHYVEHLVKNKLRRNHQLLAIGGGIIQDITCFLAANMLRGVPWSFIPTTLLAQADSCIGSKSSINCGTSKNILGTFTPPERIFIHVNFLKSLSQDEMHSGVGEMLKVHAIDGEVSFNKIAHDYDTLFQDTRVLLAYIYQSLLFKKAIIEEDEFDRDIRHVMNYGHTFGHAIESATHYKIPHGIAVTIGMDMANYVAMKNDLTSRSHYERMHVIFKKNYANYVDEVIPMDLFLMAIMKDKKNMSNHAITSIQPNQCGKPEKVVVPNDKKFQHTCLEYFECELSSDVCVSS
jgi:3-dehydroquinate synthase